METDADTLAAPCDDRAGHASTPPEEAGALLRLLACGGALRPRQTLLEQAGNATAALAAGRSAWRACGLTAPQIASLSGAAPAGETATLDWLQAPRHHMIGWHHPDYPPLLRRIDRPPLALFVAGDPSLLWHPAVAIVGSRRPTAGGRDIAAAFSRALARSGFAVASGMAAGIDTAAHQGCLDVGGATVAVLGTGPDVPYPRGNTALHARIVETGAVVSEHLPGTGPHKAHFPTRNRILAGLGLGTVVVEAALRSGALITARLAAESGREVFAVPGSIHNPMARGCHRLIRDGAALVEGVDEVIAALAPMAAKLAGELRRRLGALEQAPHAPTSDGRAGVTPPQPPGLADSCDDLDHKKLWVALGHDPTGMDELVERSGLTAAQVSSMLLLMELDGRVTVQHGRYFRSH